MLLEQFMLRRSGRRRHKELVRKIQESLSNNIQRKAIQTATRHIRRKSLEAATEAPDWNSLLSSTRNIKRDAIANLQSLVAEFAASAKRNGSSVHYARTKAEAVEHITRILESNRVKLVVKTKSMVCEELTLNTHLSEKGFDVVETDLGERIIQLAKQRPSHIVAPAVHLTVGQVAEIFRRNLNAEVPEVAEEITKLARDNLREDFLNADAGITGANFAVAQDGSVLIVTNEGNDRLVTSLPRIHIVVTGIEKVVPSLKDALALTEVLCLSATGQKATSYVSVLKSPGVSVRGELREMHIILLDNQRSHVAADEVFRQELYCIKCASCLNVCPTYRQVGGHVFGLNYTGPIGIPWTAFTEGYDAAADFAPLCVSCGLCKVACPEDINVPLLIGQVKNANIKQDGQLPVNWFLSRYESFVKFLSATAPISNWLFANRGFRWLLEKTIGIDRRRVFPKFTRATFRLPPKPAGTPGRKEVAYFVDTYAQYNNPALGKVAVNVLSKLGYDVVLPPQKGCGMPAFLYGEIDRFKDAANFNVKSLLQATVSGVPVVASEPTAAYCLRELYPPLLGTNEAKAVAKNSFEVLGFLLENGDFSGLRLNTPSSRPKVVYHTPCHTRSLYQSAPGPELLRKLGVDVEVVDHEGCCGIAGTYGFKKGADGFDLSMAVGEELFDSIRALKPDYVCTESSVCKMQIEQALGIPVKHPLEIIDEILADGELS